MDKRQLLIADLRRLNRTLDERFLGQFSDAELMEYRDRLDAARAKHLKLALPSVAALMRACRADEACGATVTRVA